MFHTSPLQQTMYYKSQTTLVDHTQATFENYLRSSILLLVIMNKLSLFTRHDASTRNQIPVTRNMRITSLSLFLECCYDVWKLFTNHYTCRGVGSMGKICEYKKGTNFVTAGCSTSEHQFIIANFIRNYAHWYILFENEIEWSGRRSSRH